MPIIEQDTPAAPVASAPPQSSACAASDAANDSTADAGCAILPHRSGGGQYVGRRRIASMQSIAIAATLMSVGAAQVLTGRTLSQKVSRRENEHRVRLRELREAQPLPAVYYAPPFKKVPVTQQDHERLAAAQAKRDRRAAKRAAGAQP